MPQNTTDLVSFILSFGVALPLGLFVRAIVRYLQPVWSNVDARLSGLLNFIVTFVFGILLSFAWTGYAYAGQGVRYTLGLGILAAGVAVIYNDIRGALGLEQQKGSGVGVMKIPAILKTRKVLKKNEDSKNTPAPKVGSVPPQQ